MAKEGWILLHRTLLDHWVYKEKCFSDFHAWIDLLLIAEHTTHKQMWRGSLTTFTRGDVCLSITQLGNRWNWSRGKVKRFLIQLEEDGMIHLNVHPNRTVVTIVNYDNYQKLQTPKRTPKRTPNDTANLSPNGTADDTHLKNNKETDKEVKEKKSASQSEEQEMSDDEWWEKFCRECDEEEAAAGDQNK